MADREWNADLCVLLRPDYIDIPLFGPPGPRTLGLDGSDLDGFLPAHDLVVDRENLVRAEEYLCPRRLLEPAEYNWYLDRLLDLDDYVMDVLALPAPDSRIHDSQSLAAHLS